MPDLNYDQQHNPEAEIQSYFAMRKHNNRAGVMKLVMAHNVQESMQEMEVARQAAEQAAQAARRREEALAVSATNDVQLETSPVPLEPTEDEEQAAMIEAARTDAHRALDANNVLQFPDRNVDGVDDDQKAA